MEASALRAPGAVGRPRLAAPVALLRLRSDEQLVALFRAGSEDAFRVIYERYRARLFAYARQMLPGSRQDAEDALQDVFVRAYRHLRASDRELALRPWLYRVAHNRCVDALRRPPPPSPELLEVVRPPAADPLAEAERREDLRRLVADIRRLPAQQRSALAMRELEGMAYQDIAGALDVTVAAVKSLLVRARMGLAQAGEARETACEEIREQLALARDRGVRASGQARRHLRDCASCRAFKQDLRGVERSLAAFAPAVGPLALAAKLLGAGGAAGGASGAAASGGGVATGGALASTGVAAGGTLATAAATKVVAVVAVAAVAAGGAAVELKLVEPPATSPTPPAAVALPSPAPVPAVRARSQPRLAGTPGSATRSARLTHSPRAHRPARHSAVRTPPAPPVAPAAEEHPVPAAPDTPAVDAPATDPAAVPTPVGSPPADGTVTSSGDTTALLTGPPTETVGDVAIPEDPGTPPATVEHARVVAPAPVSPPQ